jgi:hypothetical protein
MIMAALLRRNTPISGSGQAFRRPATHVRGRSSLIAQFESK